MQLARRIYRGFTLIELMVAIAVLVVLAMLALPSFQEVRQRAAIRGAAENVLSFWNQAKLESAKRNTYVKVGLRQSSSGKVFCLGAATTTDPGDTTTCDCRAASPSSDVCDVARFPADNSEWNGVTLSSVTLGGSGWTTASGSLQPAIIESKLTSLTQTSAIGGITMAGPVGRRAYQLTLNVDALGRGVLCEPSGATDKMSDYGKRRC